MMVDKMEVMKALRKQAVWCVKCFNDKDFEYVHGAEVAKLNGMIELAKVIGITDEEIEQAVYEAKN